MTKAVPVVAVMLFCVRTRVAKVAQTHGQCPAKSLDLFENLKP